MKFRQWVYNKWFEYRDEVEAWEHRRVTGSPEDYFRKWKWFLKEKYKQEKRNG